jgi:short-subunit dehydrogenase
MSKASPRALITGASAGIGLSYAEHLARTGHDLVIVARRAERLKEIAERLQKEHSIEVEVIHADLSVDADVLRVAERIEYGSPVDILINNAGYAARGKVADLDADALDAMLRVNVLAMSRLSRSAMGRMTAEGKGTIINIASATVFLLIPGNAGYGASKNYVAAFTRHMQLEAKGTGVRVQLLVPGIVATDFHKIAGADLANYPQDRIMQVDDLVVASLRALEMNEEICIPSLPDVRDWDAYVAAEQGVAANVSRDHIAARYH